ncbi:MAG: hypothetical protein AAFO69_03435 [Bacteroidota bacterium]
MIVPIPSNHERFQIELEINALKRCLVGIVVYDPTRPNTDYFRRKVHFKSAGKRSLQILMPLSPKHCVLELFNKRTGGDEYFQVNDFKVTPLAKPQVWGSPARHQFMEFAFDFAQKAGYTKTGFYDSPNHEFLFQYLPTIRDGSGKEVITPARIHRQMPRVQLSQKMFRKYSIPIRVFILAHEGCHYFLNTRSQTRADLCGLKYYLDYGFPRIEGVYAATQIFAGHPMHVGSSQIKRTKDIIDFITKYEQNKKAA